MPKDEKLRKQYKILLKIENLIIDSKDTRLFLSLGNWSKAWQNTSFFYISVVRKGKKKKREITRVIVEETVTSDSKKRLTRSKTTDLIQQMTEKQKLCPSHSLTDREKLSQSIILI